MASLPWAMSKFMGHPSDTAAWKFVDDFLKLRLKHMEPVLAGREWLAGTFSVADILMSDVLRLVDQFDGLADIPPAAPTSRAPPPARPSPRPTPTRWRISLRRTRPADAARGVTCLT